MSATRETKGNCDGRIHQKRARRLGRARIVAARLPLGQPSIPARWKLEPPIGSMAALQPSRVRELMNDPSGPKPKELYRMIPITVNLEETEMKANKISTNRPFQNNRCFACNFFGRLRINVGRRTQLRMAEKRCASLRLPV